ncbi:Hypothetical protein CpMEX30_0707 [Corynebacterium pseudotuberculosis]|uniref:Uncharacterized protein n=2 Tax=Corynebacterium pseudotuberculosis TaxID=1719 RepID=D9Q9C0_CORP2|nr:hypothetical protein [Corynebacterium pseudotuberculosis]ADL10146.1 hypothetical protein CPC231_03340 [Corynebacterium pseudotuberculosis C231]ADL20557.1 hypothetical protein CP1002_09795 [Corynebacterium pseudotuberculosis 1002]AEP69920.1 Hypothetical protein Cp4202_0657 [Corynebacterium pseudotuberculosis 42/02-A]AEQ06221.1 hypothetical protein CPCIP5297_03480 [Corynebacterium pseudotuberculosis CIP 52.97]AER68734.1 Hypothetical protein Cp106_0650 [Corynebacterium pseudotuberculosis 1/06-
MLERKRRRVFKASPAKDYDRHADSASHNLGAIDSTDDERFVSLDGEPLPLSHADMSFWKEQEPPHYGTQ